MEGLGFSKSTMRFKSIPAEFVVADYADSQVAFGYMCFE
jgi:hypothetical protein